MLVDLRTDEEGIVAMILYPGEMKKAQAELDRVVGGDRLPEWEDAETLPFIQALIKEVMRYVALVHV